jgi:enoyl-CoA hydratase/carnithine racemase
VSTVGVSVDDAGVAVVTIDNPPINLMTIEVFVELAGAVDRLAGDDDVRAVVLRSADPEWFIAHFDVEAILGFPTDQPPPTRLNGFHVMCEQLRTMAKPTIAQIAGRVGGGGSEIALSCDMRFVTPDTVLSQPEVALGIIPGGSGTVRLPRLIGRGRALEVILGCDDVDAATAERWGWVNRVVPAAEITEFVDRLAARIAAFPAHAVAAAKASVVGADIDIEAQLLSEGAAFDATLADPVTQGAMRRFLEIGGQTPEGERRLGALAADVAAGADRPMPSA